MAVKFRLAGCLLGLLLVGGPVQASTPDDVEKNLAQVSQLLGEGKVEQAHQLLVSALKADSGQIAYHISYIELMNQVGQREAVEKSYRQLAESSPKDAGLAFLHAQTLEDRDARGKRFQEAQKIDEGSPWPYLGLASLSVLNGNGNEAIQLLEKCLSISPTLEPALEMLAMLQATKGDVNKAIAVNLKLLAQDRSNARAAEALGRLYTGVGDIDKAIEAYETGATLEPENATVWANLGHLYFATLRYEDALNAYHTVMSFVDTDENSRVMASICQRILGGDLPAAVVEDVMKARGLADSDPDAALVLFQKAVAAAPDFELAQLGLGQIYLSKGEPTLASRALNEALLLNPKLSEIRVAYSQLMVANGLLPQAETHLRAAVEFQPDNPTLYLELAQLYTAMRVPQGAEAAYAHALRYLDGEDAVAAQVNLAGAIAAQGRSEEAIEVLSGVLSFKADNVGVLLALGDLHLDRERFDEARKNYRAVLKFDPKHGGAQAQMALADELEAIYKQNLASKSRASQILVTEEAEAKRLLGELEGGADFEALARAHSKGPESIDGGDLGFFDADSLSPDLSSPLSKAKVGDYTGIIKTASGYHILMRTN